MALNENPAVILTYWGGISGADMTHLCTFDIPLISNIPNIVYLAPTSVEEYLAMLDWGIEQKERSVVIRVPRDIVHEEKVVENFGNLNKYKVVKEGSKVAIIAEGSFLVLGKKVCEELKNHNIDATLINPRYLTGIDEELLTKLEENHDLVATLEDGEVDGGFGEKIARFYGVKSMKVLNFGAKKEFTDKVSINELYERYHLTYKLVVDDIVKAL